MHAICGWMGPFAGPQDPDQILEGMLAVAVAPT